MITRAISALRAIGGEPVWPEHVLFVEGKAEIQFVNWYVKKPVHRISDQSYETLAHDLTCAAIRRGIAKLPNVRCVQVRQYEWGAVGVTIERRRESDFEGTGTTELEALTLAMEGMK